MIKSHISFIFGLLVLLTVVLPLNYYVLEELLDLPFSKLHYFVYGYFVFIITLIHIYMVQSLKERPQRFVIAFMASMGIKILISLLLLVVIMYTGINNTKTFAINYLALYFIFSSFSVFHTLKTQKSAEAKL